ncbi:cell adhesion molecule CEACAM16-like [Leptodactylus fuscus]|uniref:cell adhesion molecule CEACAM16-like n=1 Tax=Leptodactylus fuscus TaxID=238119 RepID=UPI003F4EFBFE
MSGRRSSLLGGFVLAVLLQVCTSVSSKLSIDVIPPRPKTGDTVTLSVIGVDGKILFASWYRGLSTSATDQILTYVNGKDIPGDKYIWGASCRQNGSLVIQNFQVGLSGEYTVQIQTNRTLQDGQVTISGVGFLVLSPFTVLSGLLLFSAANYL